MIRNYTLEYWNDDGWFVGKIKEIPGIFSQGATLEELEDNIKEAYKLILAEPQATHPGIKTKEISVEVT